MIALEIKTWHSVPNDGMLCVQRDGTRPREAAMDAKLSQYDQAAQSYALYRSRGTREPRKIVKPRA